MKNIKSRAIFEEEGEQMIPIRKYNYNDISDLDGIKVYNKRLEAYGYINDDNIRNWDKIGSSVFVSSKKGEEQGHYWDDSDVYVIPEELDEA